ncbi:sterol desaturase family protein [Sphingomonas sp. H39-1-10]|uniref:sterol desaturase family protein n=1 Tax=Sphingomonadales TaxID=204457 RepID=UPI001F5BE137|nr:MULTISPECIES: sterol desaturase family protein [Sphingomonadaceae]MDF0490120.1 sterol desaturase family protein [Sphingomonas pollutisoli]
MTLRSLTVAFFQYPAVWAYLLLALAAGVLAWMRPSTILQNVAAVVAAGLIYPLVWYVLHRWVLHSRWMFKSPLTAGVWKRIHYDHHIDPNHLEVLFGALYTTLPTIAVATMPIGWFIGGFGAAMMAFAAGLLITCFYEFVHCVEHLPYKPRNRLFAEMKARHLAHHFHDENGNYGITNFTWDRLFGTLYERRDRPMKSPTVFNLGYDEAAGRRWPWVARMSAAPVPVRSGKDGLSRDV